MEFVDYNGNDITSLITQPNDNLLTNSDFRNGIINQKGEAVYNGQSTWLYGIDMWKAVDVTIDTQFKGQLTISGNGYLVQLIDLSIDTYTLTFKIININKGTIDVYLEQTEPVHEETISSSGLHSFVYKTTKNAKGVGIRLNNFSGDIEFIKLEKGNQFTGMPAWNESEELNKCIRKYISFIGQATMKSIYVGQNYAVLSYELPFPVYTHPRIVIPPNTGMYWQNHDSSDPINTTITSGMVTGVQGNTVTIQLFGSFGNATWKSAYMHSVGIAFDFNEY